MLSINRRIALYSASFHVRKFVKLQVLVQDEEEKMASYLLKYHIRKQLHAQDPNRFS